MQAEDMSIYWNQRKGQYETNNFYTEDNNTFTRTADKRLMYQETDHTEVLDEEAAETREVPLLSWFGTLILCSIPGINIVALIAMAAGSKDASKKAFARAMIILSLLMITLLMVFMALTCDKMDYAAMIDSIINIGKKFILVVQRTL